MFKRNQKILGNTPWTALSATEGLLLAFELSLIKIIALFFLSPVLSIFTILILGVVKIIGSVLITLRSGFAFFPNQKAVLGSMLVGLVYSYMVLVPLYVFSQINFPITLFALMIFLGIVPGTIWNKYSSYGRFDRKQITGFVLVILSILGILQFPKITEIFDTPVVLWLILTIPIGSLLIDIITRRIGTSGTISPWVHNIWIGVSMVIFGLIGIFATNISVLTDGVLLFNFKSYIWLIVLSGLVSLFVVLFRQKSFTSGGSFGEKKLLSSIVVVIAAILIDAFFFGIILRSSLFIATALMTVGYLFIDIFYPKIIETKKENIELLEAPKNGFVCVIPARYASGRFPGKPLCNINGKAMIDHVYENANKAKLVRKAIIATDDQRIYDHCKEKGFEVVMTKEHPNGSERVNEVVESVNDKYVFEMQGDQPLLLPDMVDDFLRRAKNIVDINPSIDVVHPYSKATKEHTEAKHVVKAVKSVSDRLLFQTRQPIQTGVRTLGLYLWNKDSLKRFSEIEPSEIEVIEDTHPMRLYINDFYVQGLPIDGSDWVEVDLKEQVYQVEEVLRRREREA
jgi:3-deoxy-manno-octulosonate cytidylyltransferase (CMP-KDO synthetase)